MKHSLEARYILGIHFGDGEKMYKKNYLEFLTQIVLLKLKYLFLILNYHNRI